MSLAALLIGVADHLTQGGNFGLTRDDCEIMADGMPPEKSGPFFTAIHPASWRQTNDSGTALDEQFAFEITISARGRGLPIRQWGRDLLCQQSRGGTGGGLYARAEFIRAALHVKYQPLARANSLIDIAARFTTTEEPGDPPANGFDPEPIFFSGGALPIKRRPDWWGGTEEPAEGGSPWAGLSLTISFQPVRRVQDVLLQT